MPDDEAEFARFMRGASRRLQRAAWALTGDWALAEDLVQTALVKVWRNWSKVDQAAAYGYARRALVSTFIDWHRRLSATETPAHQFPDVHDHGVQAERAELQIAMTAAIQRLPRRQRAVIVLRYYEDLDVNETAEVMGCSVGTVKSHTARAMKTLRATAVALSAEGARAR